MLTVNSFTLDLPGRICVRAKQYVPQSPGSEIDTQGDSGVILLFAHALGYHKEQWEPVIQELFQEDHVTGSGALVKEAWSIDCPDHGESAVLNEAELEDGKRYISCYEYGDAFIYLIRSGFLDRGRKLIFVGHSAGAVTGIISTTRYHQSENPYSSMILIEPSLISQDVFATNSDIPKGVAHLSKSSGSRRDIWPSAAHAKSWMVQRSPWKFWDPRALDIYVQFGMRPLPTRIYPNIDTGVTLSFPKLTQSLAYYNLQDQYDAVDQLRIICRTPHCRVHVVFGRRIDYNPKAAQDEIASIVGGSTCKNVSYIENAGHMTIQEDPTRVAKVLCRILHNDYDNICGKL